MFWRKRKEQFAGSSSGAPLSSRFSLGVGVGEAVKQSPPVGTAAANADKPLGGPVVGGREAVFSVMGTSALERPSYVLPKGYRVSGMIFVAGDVRIDGELSGRGIVAHKVEISVAGRVNCSVDASVILVAGSAHGALRARDLVEVQAGGRVQGAIDAPSLRVSIGAILSDARCAIGK